MLLSNRWGKSEGDHIILQSLKINHACSFCLLSPILFMPLFCLFLGMRTVRRLSHVTQFCHPPFSCWHRGDSAAELWLRFLQFSAALCWSWTQYPLIPREWDPEVSGEEGRTTDWGVSVDGCVTKAHTFASICTIHHQPLVHLLLCNFFSPLVLQQFEFVGLFHTFKDHGWLF